MIAIIQRVKYATVKVEGEIKGSIKQGFLVLLGVEKGDLDADCQLLAKKTTNLRIFNDEDYKMNRSLLDVKGEVLVISNFTLCANNKKGNRPSFDNAMPPVEANRMYEDFCQNLKNEGVEVVEKGVFGAEMAVELLNDGPITITLDTKVWRKKC
ncbi:MAG: D-tyrosyl-tRNA(Tyr) deacylase [Clostridia bacterium]|nr:D-tyrosyl-tRNA(Tyr) deacylase [Clostridia bacterium]MBQ9977725.1 D-tyrosyl-tRNA(Tyr) deacylase [Clostridia bacterium]